MKVVYIAGPFWGKNSWEMENNIRRAEALSLEVWRLGAAALCPHTNTRFFQGAAADKVFLDGTLELLRRCDVLLLTKDWDRSSGAREEYKEAIRLDLPIFNSIEALADWLAVIKHPVKRPQDCNKPHHGWLCSLEKGHFGPCSAYLHE